MVTTELQTAQNPVSYNTLEIDEQSMDASKARFYYTKTGVIIPTITGTISFLSSLIIVSFILRSKQNTTYHRIIFMLSFYDLLTSFAIAITTLPMPRDVIYPFSWPSYGNQSTCAAQGMSYMIGNGGMLCMNGILNIYYLFTLRYKMEEKFFSRYLEPPLYSISVLLSTIVPGVFLYWKKLLNPSPFDPYCGPYEYPINCDRTSNRDDTIECRGAGGTNHFTTIYYVSMITACSTLIVTMGLIIHTFYRSERSLKNEVNQNDGSDIARKATRMVTTQASLYVGAFFLTWTFTLVCFLTRSFGTQTVLEGLRMTFQPLQGLFNLLIFFYHKVDLVRKSDEDLRFVEALYKTMIKPEEVPEVVVSRIEIIAEHDVQRIMKITGSYRSSEEARICDTPRAHIDESCTTKDKRSNKDLSISELGDDLSITMDPNPSLTSNVSYASNMLIHSFDRFSATGSAENNDIGISFATQSVHNDENESSSPKPLGINYYDVVSTNNGSIIMPEEESFEDDSIL